MRKKRSENKGIIIVEKGAKPKSHEYITAYALVEAGYEVRFIPNSLVVGMADSYLDNVLFEFKAPEGKGVKCIERNLRKAVNYQCENIVIDSFRIKNIQDRSIQSFLCERLSKGHGIKRLLFVNRERKTIDINKLLR